MIEIAIALVLSYCVYRAGSRRPWGEISLRYDCQRCGKGIVFCQKRRPWTSLYVAKHELRTKASFLAVCDHCGGRLIERSS